MSLSRDQTVRLCTLGIPLLLILLISALLQFANVFPTHISPFYKNDPSLSFPSVPETLSGPVLLLICLVVPILCIVVPTLPTPPSDGFLYSLPCIGNFLTYIFSGALKCMTGELRPSFLALCQVNESMELDGNYVNSTMSAVICTGKDALDGRHSFPSSHCSQALFGAILSILIIQKIKCDLTNLWSPLWLSIKASLQFLLLTFGSWVAVSRLVDYHHHWWDVLAGSTLGTVFAVALFKWFLEPVMDHIEKLSDDPGNSVPGVVNVKTSEANMHETGEHNVTTERQTSTVLLLE